MLVTAGDKDKIVAKILLRYPNVDDSMIPDSYAPLEKEADKTSSWDDLIGLFKGIKNRTEHEERSLTKLLEAKKLCKESGLSKPEAMGRVGF